MQSKVNSVTDSTSSGSDVQAASVGRLFLPYLTFNQLILLSVRNETFWFNLQINNKYMDKINN